MAPVQSERRNYFTPQTAPQNESPSVPSTKASGPKVLTFALQHRPKATRVSVPKVRTGCITCKKRHVKCDETKPSCTRCMKWQGYCDGYEAPNPSSSSSSQRRRASTTTPKSSDSTPSPPANSEAVAVSAITRGRPLLLAPDFNTSVFSYQREKVYFDHWLALAPNIGGGWFKSNLWTHTIPQLCREEPAVRYAAMAVGAMANAMAPNMLPKTDQMVMGRGPHYSNALTYYGRALRLIRLQQTPEEGSSPRAAILACLLFVCFETLHGNREAALHHINHGLQVVEQFVRTNSPDQSFESIMTKSPAPYVLEDEIMQVFRRLDFQGWSIGLLRPRRTHATPSTANFAKRVPFRDLPSSFANLAEARGWWDLVQHWILQFPRSVVSQLVKQMGNADPEAAKRMDLCDVPGVRELQKLNLNCLEAWNAAFWPLYNVARQNKKIDEESYLMAISLQIQYLIAWINMRSICFSEYQTMYLLTPQFRELVRLGSILLPKQPKYAGCSEAFTLDNGPTMALFIVATKCRDPDVRDEAQKLLEKYPRRDGFWDSRAMVAISKMNKVVEVENETEGDYREQWARLRQREAVFDDKAPQAKVHFYRKDPVAGEFKLVEHLISWGTAPGGV